MGAAHPKEWARCGAGDKEETFLIKRWAKFSFSFMNSSVQFFTRGNPDGENLFCCKLKGNDCPVNARS